jgi:hypothetical protein
MVEVIVGAVTTRDIRRRFVGPIGRNGTLIVVDEVLYRNFVHSDGTRCNLQVILPMSMRRDFVRTAHDMPTGEHFMRRRTANHVQRRAY